MANNVKSTTGGEFDNENPPFSIQSAQPAVSFDFDEADPPWGDYVTVPDLLVIWAVALGGGSSVRVNLRILRPDGVIIPFAISVPGNVTPTITPQTFNLPEGYILSGSITATGGTGVGAPMYAHVGLRRSPSTANDTYHVLFQGQVLASVPMPFEAAVSRVPADGNGVIGTTAISTPGAGADFSFTVPNGVRMRPISLCATLTTSVAVSNRNPTLIIDDGVNVVADISASVAAVASGVFTITWADSMSFNSFLNSSITAALPGNMFMLGGWHIRSVSSGIQAGDQWSAIRMATQNWIDLS
jgi:hypothetical protein